MLQDIVIKVISSHLGNPPESIQLDMKLEDLGVDSLGAITIMYELEDQLDVQIPNDVFDSLVIVKDIVGQLDRLLEQQRSK